MAPRLALLLVGLWLGALFLSWAVATVNFRTVDRVLGKGARPELQERLAGTPPPARREALRHLASEQNRGLFGGLALAQLGMGALLLGLSWRWPGASLALAAAALLIVLVQLGLGLPIASLGRSIDFVPRPLPAEIGRRFGLLHAAFVLLDLLKAALLSFLAFTLVRRS
jgi:hypothetical protein